jgi:hypothetical protein
MPDYASILKRSISGLADPSPEMREAVYQRARAALARQLTAVEPPLSSREIELQHQELEDAVARIEAEFAPATPDDGLSAEPVDDDFLYTPQPSGHERRQQASQPAEFGAAPSGGAAFDEEDDEEYEDEEEPGGSRLPLLIGILAVVLVLVGVGTYVFAERATLFGSSKSEEAADHVASAEPEPVAAAPEPQPAEPEKLPDRLTNGSEAPATTATAQPEAPIVAPPISPPAQTDSSTSPQGLPLENLSGLGPEANPSSESDTNLVEQRAIYYYQGSEGQPGQASEGSATWAEITKDNRPAIQATLRIPERNVSVTVTIYKNYDTALPASHLVEVQFNGALADSPIQRVPALVLKQTEQARGQPLAGAAVPVTNELFWIALSNAEEDVARNVQLLREGSWFDIPILFGDQTRALITFEKGIPGDKVFETVMASWTPS